MKVNIDQFVKQHQIEIETLVNLSLNKAAQKLKDKIAAQEIQANFEEIMPVLLYEVLVTNTVATLRLAAEMFEEAK